MMPGAATTPARPSFTGMHRDPGTEDQRLGDTDLYAAAVTEMQAVGLLGYPSYPVDPEIAVGHRLDHVWSLPRARRPRARADRPRVRQHHSVEPTPQRLRRARMAAHAVGRRRQPADLRDRLARAGTRPRHGAHLRRVRRRMQPDSHDARGVGTDRRAGAAQGVPVRGLGRRSVAVRSGPRPASGPASRRSRRRVDRGAVREQRCRGGGAAGSGRARTRWARPRRHRRQSGRKPRPVRTPSSSRRSSGGPRTRAVRSRPPPRSAPGCTSRSRAVPEAVLAWPGRWHA